MEFQAHKVLVIAADIRQLDHIEYTPAPDIIHEAAGHAPIIADIEYANYLQRIGEVGAKAMSSRKDYELYEAIRHLSILKEAPDSDPSEIKKAEDDVTYRQANLGEPSEMALLSRLHWWTVEYGLIGTLDNPKIYGAGLLSSIGESANCVKPTVKKLPYTIDAQNYAFDITTQQPQLFVTPSFQHLNDVLEEFAATMAFRTGGLAGVRKAIDCANVSTVEYSSGLQVSGIFSDMLTDDIGQLAYLKTDSPTQLAFGNRELPGHDKGYHQEGFGSPVGKLRHHPLPLEECTDTQLEFLGVVAGRHCELIYESGVRVTGQVESVVRESGRVILVTFTDCKVTYNGTVLFQPSWGKYDMAVGARITSVFAGAADKDAYDQPSLVPRERTIKVTYDSRRLRLHELYQKVRDCRESRSGFDTLSDVWRTLKSDYPEDWLLPLEILEILTKYSLHEQTAAEIKSTLQKRALNEEDLTKLISDGLNLLNK